MDYFSASRCGRILFLGSGETSHAGGQAMESLIQGQKGPLRIRILETPAGFELNSARVAGRVGDYLATRLQNYQPDVQIIPARRVDGHFSTNSEDLCQNLADADLIYLGAGSPTYAIHHLKQSRIWNAMLAAFFQGAHLAFASAATIAMGTHALPIYEIYKVGMDPFWNKGLDFLANMNLSASFVPHWNNQDGGAELDTSRCFLGQKRFEALAGQIPNHHAIIGLDEQTGVILDWQTQSLGVIGKGKLHLIRENQTASFSDGQKISFESITSAHAGSGEPLASELWEMVQAVRSNRDANPEILEIPEEASRLLNDRKEARERKDWMEADRIRQELQLLGWQVKDTPDGARLERMS